MSPWPAPSRTQQPADLDLASRGEEAPAFPPALAGAWARASDSSAVDLWLVPHDGENAERPAFSIRKAAIYAINCATALR